MIVEKMDCLFSARARRILIPASIFSGLFCLLLVRYSQDDSLKILWLYAMYACIMFLVVLYKNFLSKYEIAIFCFLGVQLLASAPFPDDMNGLTVTAYLLSYRYGVSSRSFVATIVDFFTQGGFVSKYFVWHFIFAGTVFLSFVISVCIGTAIRKAKDDMKYFLLLASLLWVSAFTSPSAYFLNCNFGRVEIFAQIILFVAMLIIRKPTIRWLVPLLAVIVMATHLILVFFYIPLIGILLLHELLKNEKPHKRDILLFIATAKTILAIFIAYLLFGRGTFIFDDARSFYEYLSAKTDLIIGEWELHMTMFASLEDHLVHWRNRVSLGFHGNWTVLMSMPLVSLFVAFWLKCFRTEVTKTMKLFFLLPILALLYQAVAFFIFFDFGRWMTMVINVQFMTLFYLAMVKNRTVLSVAQAITPFVKRHAFFVVLACLLMAFLGPVDVIGPTVHRGTSTFPVLRLFFGM